MSDISQSSDLNIRNLLLEMVSEIDDDEVAVFLSSGMDSRCILFALLEYGKKVHTYSFTLDDRVSTDCRVAEDVSKTYGVKFTRIVLPTSIDILKRDVILLHNKYGCMKKTEYECVWPFLYSYKVIDERVVSNGIRADIHFGNFKRARIHYKDDLDGFRREVFSDVNGGQKIQHSVLAKEYNKILFEPFRDQRMIDHFMGSTFEQCNKPHPKQPILDSFPEYFSKYKVYGHTNFQAGDSGILEHFDKLLQTDWNIHNYKSVVGIFNVINRGELNGRRKLI